MGQFGLVRELFIQELAQEIERSQDLVVRERVIDVHPFALCVDQAAFAQDFEVTRGRGGREVDISGSVIVHSFRMPLA
jgi:hypothetical protein